MDFSFFITDNKSGYKTNIKWLEKNHPEELFKILSYCKNKIPENSSIKEKIWFYYHKLISKPTCNGCGSEIKFSERFDRGYNDFCSVKCINSNKEEMTNRVSKTFQEKYGINFYSQHKDFIIKQKNTKKLKYGSENYNNVEKTKNTKKLKYGSENYSNVEKYKETCLKKYSVDNFSKSNDFKTLMIKNYQETYPDLKIISTDKTNIKIFCDKCNNTYETTKQLVYERTKINSEICTICNPLGQCFVSEGENKISDFIRSLGVKVLQNQKLLKNKKEIDIFLPEFNIGFEYNGLYWHNELFVEDDYHLNKTKGAKLLGIDLYHIFEDEWVYKKDIIKSIIKNKLKKIDKKIYARKCEIKEITPTESKTFLDKNHIQGSVNSKVHLGLFNNGSLVSVMTFNKGRIVVGGKSNEWELTRFSNIIDTNVIGGSSKLLKFFLEKYKPEKIISYSDNRLFNGNLYPKLGFKEIHHNRPNYWYVVNGIRYHRFSFRKSVLVKNGEDKNLSEHQIMLNKKIYRIYDCGTIRWEF